MAPVDGVRLQNEPPVLVERAYVHRCQMGTEIGQSESSILGRPELRRFIAYILI